MELYFITHHIDNNFIYLNATDHWTIIEKNNINYPENGETDS